MADGFDTSELDKYAAELLHAALRDFPKETKKFVRREGAKLRRETLNKAKSLVKKGNRKRDDESTRYHKSIKAGKVYVYKGDGGMSIRVFSSAPHASLIENGHRQVVNPMKDGKRMKGRNIGKQVGTVKGKYVFEKSGKAFEGKFHADIDDFLDELLGGV